MDWEAEYKELLLKYEERGDIIKNYHLHALELNKKIQELTEIAARHSQLMSMLDLHLRNSEKD